MPSGIDLAQQVQPPRGVPVQHVALEGAPVDEVGDAAGLDGRLHGVEGRVAAAPDGVQPPDGAVPPGEPLAEGAPAALAEAERGHGVVRPVRRHAFRFVPDVPCEKRGRVPEMLEGGPREALALLRHHPVGVAGAGIAAKLAETGGGRADAPPIDIDHHRVGMVALHPLRHHVQNQVENHMEAVPGRQAHEFVEVVPEVFALPPFAPAPLDPELDGVEPLSPHVRQVAVPVFAGRRRRAVVLRAVEEGKLGHRGPLGW